VQVFDITAPVNSTLVNKGYPVRYRQTGVHSSPLVGSS
jgi:hypothetical protein